MDFNANFGFKERTVEQRSNYRKEYIEFIDSEKLENIMSYIYGYMSDIFNEGPILREELVSIINLLETEIEKHEN